MQIRKLTVQDWESLKSLRLLALQEYPDAFAMTHEEEAARSPEQWQQRVAAPDATWIGAWDGARLVAMAGLIRQSREKLRHKALVIAVYTHREYRGRGLGEAVLLELIANARTQAGLLYLNLTVVSDNAGAARLYERLGFTAWGREPGALLVAGRPVDELHMSLALS